MAGMPTLFVYDLQVAAPFQHKGVGLHLLNTLQLVARKEGMTFISMLVPDGVVAIETFIATKLKGWEEDVRCAFPTEIYTRGCHWIPRMFA
jgi:GNAT superfamily N-acetyltransferase